MTPPSRPHAGILVGGGMAIGAAIGMIFGLLLSADFLPMVGVGVVAGLIVGAVVDLQRRGGVVAPCPADSRRATGNTAPPGGAGRPGRGEWPGAVGAACGEVRHPTTNRP